ncbi:MAG: MoaD/ThiS family protein [Lutisporaceae bacterium]
MKITVRLFATFRDGRQKVLDMNLPETATPQSIIDALGIHQTDVAILLVNGRDGRFDKLLDDNDTVSLFPPVGGG